MSDRTMGGLPVHQSMTDDHAALDALAREHHGERAFVPGSSFEARGMPVVGYIDSPRGTWVIVRPES